MLTRMNINMRRSRISRWLGAASLVALTGFLHAENAIFMGYGEGARKSGAGRIVEVPRRAPRSAAR